MKHWLFYLFLFGYSADVICAQQLPQYHQRLFTNAVTAYEDERYIEAVELLEELLEIPLKETEPWLLLASTHMALYDYSSAIKTIENALELMPAHIRLLQANADIHLEMEEYTKALGTFKKIYRIEKAGSDEIRQLSQRIAALNTHIGGLAVQENRLDAAETYFSDALRFDPDSLYNYTNLIFVKLENEDPDGALEITEQAIERFPNHSELLGVKAKILGNAGDAASLEDVLADLVMLEPDNMEFAAGYISVLLYHEKFEEAEQFTEQVIERRDLGADRYLMLAGAYQNAGFPVGRIGILQRYLQEYPDDHDVTFEKAELLETIGETERARSVYRELAGTERGAEAGQRLAWSYAGEDSLETAIDIYEKLAGEHPVDVDILWNQAVLLSRTERWSDAIRSLESVLAVSRDSRFLYEWALAHDRSGDKDAAIETYRELAEQGFYHPAMFLRLAEGEHSIPGLGEGCDMIQSLFNLVLRQSVREQELLLSTIQDEEFFQKTRPEPAQTDLNELNEISQTVVHMVAEQCSADTAEEFITEQLQIHGSSGTMQMMAARFYEERHQPDRALYLGARAAELSPNAADVHFYHASLLETSGETDDARFAYERVIAIDAYHEDAYTALLRIHRNTNLLDELCDRWLIRYRTDRNNDVLYRYLNEALLRAGRWNDAQALRQERE